VLTPPHVLDVIPKNAIAKVPIELAVTVVPPDKIITPSLSPTALTSVLVNPDTDHDIETVAYGDNPVIVVPALLTVVGLGELLYPGDNVRANESGVVSANVAGLTVDDVVPVASLLNAANPNVYVVYVDNPVAVIVPAPPLIVVVFPDIKLPIIATPSIGPAVLALIVNGIESEFNPGVIVPITGITFGADFATVIVLDVIV
jgi:hypothetical protein